MAAGADSQSRIAKTESAADVKARWKKPPLAAEQEFGRPEGSTLLMAALESAAGVLSALEICRSSGRLFGIAALSGGDSHEGSPDFDYRDRGKWQGSQEAYDPGSQGC